MPRQGLRALCFCLGLLAMAAAQADTLRVGSWDRKTDSLVLISEAILSQAYAELRQPVEFVDLPIRRAMVSMLNGELDGNVYRIAELANEQPTLLRVETPIVFMEVRIYVAGPTRRIEQWSQLAGLRVAFQRGALIVERKLPSDSQRIEAGSIVELFRLLNRGVADVVLMVEPAQSRPHPLSGAAGITRAEGVLERTPLHHYLRNSHRQLGLRLNAVLKRMATSGDMQAITAKTLKDLD